MIIFLGTLLLGRMATQQLLQMSAVRTDGFSITGFVMFTAQGTEKNYKTTESNTTVSTGASFT
jgi:hypothetical protein